MLNELEEFKAYTTPVKYEVSRRGDTAFLGRFTFESLLNSRVWAESLRS